ncbi:hypothetical protein BB8028_0002g14530 [Beauveria bassiana]|uniref:DUF7492 domain-containing protein n=1 Tax=Beauveria bassiana TaxID=176275 RepID=A0A2S7Y4V0_BEABA|nr:hypothetical protein BB8028_0002g14530 [Beauveria bassiana]
MRPSQSTASTALLTAAAFVGLANAHSWVEEVYRVDDNGAMVGQTGYPRGWIARTSTNPPFSDTLAQWLLPLKGQSAYSGDEILNKHQKTENNPALPMLQAAPGDKIALLHLENGHVSLPQNQPKKPRNRGTIFLYGTTQPAKVERLFDVHLVWNRAGTGGDKRGKLLATRNYDDGQCYQTNAQEISTSRAQKLASEGAVHERELRCQSDVQLPDDLKPGDVYTIYWYWDWPDLDPEHIKVDATTDGRYPWAGTFMRGETDPNGFTMAAIAKNESYASTIDIQIVERAKIPPGVAVAKAADVGQSNQKIYTMAVADQLSNNFKVDIDANNAGGGSSSATTPASSPSATATGSDPAAAPSSVTPTTSSSAAAPTTTAGDASGGGKVTVTVTVTVPSSTIYSTVYVTKSVVAGDGSGSGAPPAAPVYATATASAPAPTVPAMRGRVVRRNWQFGQ